MTIAAILLTRNLRVENVSRKQLLLEAAFTFFYNFFEGILGERGKRYIPYMITVTLFIGFANIIGVFGFVPPTKDLNVTAGLAIMSIVLIEYAGFHQKGTKGWLKSFAEPTPVMLPINNGDCNPSHVALYATFWKYSRRVHCHGAAENGSAGYCAGVCGPVF